MLTKRENLMETIRGGEPDRFVNQFEALALIFDPIFVNNDAVEKAGDPDAKDQWGITWSWGEGQPGAFPLHNPSDLIVIKDIEHWRDYVKSWPRVDYSDAEWEWCQGVAESVDRDEQFVTAFVAPGLFETYHSLCEMQNALMGFYRHPDQVKDLLAFMAEKEMERAEVICDKIHPDALFHHDDWGSQVSTMVSPKMFGEFLFEPAKQIYDFYREHGVSLIVHHSDSYAATLVDYMIDMGIDIWQGVMTSNDIPGLMDKYGGRISFMGGIENGKLDRADWSQEEIDEEVLRMCEACGKKYYIPSLCAGSTFSTYDGVYDAVSAAIDKASEKLY